MQAYGRFRRLPQRLNSNNVFASSVDGIVRLRKTQDENVLKPEGSNSYAWNHVLVQVDDDMIKTGLRNPEVLCRA